MGVDIADLLWHRDRALTRSGPTEAKQNMYKGRDRNSPCWCGSGKKLKRCHLDRESSPRVQYQDAIRVDKNFHRERVCLHPNASESSCSPTIAKAHTVQKSILRQIETDGHVYQLMPTLRELVHKPLPSPSRVGINLASTFTGFCTQHDNELFAPIEKKPITYCREHAFLLTYRALCQELYKKRARVQQEMAFRELDGGLPFVGQLLWQHESRQRAFGAELAIRDFEHHKNLYDACFMNDDFSGISAVFIELCGPIEIMCSGVVFPEVDFQGNALQSLGDYEHILDFCGFSLVACDETPFALFAWLGHSKACQYLIESLLQLGERMPAALARFALGTFENMFIRPKWWDALDEARRNWIARSMMNLVRDDGSPDYWKDDGVNVIEWTVSKIVDLRQR